MVKNWFLNTNICLPDVTLSIQNNVKLLKQLESSYKRINNWNKYQSKKQKNQGRNRYLVFLIDQSFQGVNS